MADLQGGNIARMQNALSGFSSAGKTHADIAGIAQRSNQADADRFAAMLSQGLEGLSGSALQGSKQKHEVDMAGQAATDAQKLQSDQNIFEAAETDAFEIYNAAQRKLQQDADYKEAQLRAVSGDDNASRLMSDEVQDFLEKKVFRPVFDEFFEFARDADGLATTREIPSLQKYVDAAAAEQPPRVITMLQARDIWMGDLREATEPVFDAQWEIIKLQYDGLEDSMLDSFKEAIYSRYEAQAMEEEEEQAIPEGEAFGAALPRAVAQPVEEQVKAAGSQFTGNLGFRPPPVDNEPAGRSVGALMDKIEANPTVGSADIYKRLGDLLQQIASSPSYVHSTSFQALEKEFQALSGS